MKKKYIKKCDSCEPYSAAQGSRILTIPIIKGGVMEKVRDMENCEQEQPTKREVEVIVEINKLAESADILHKRLCVLDERLQPISTSRPHAVAEVDKKISTKCPLAIQIEENRELIVCAIAIIDKFLEGLEI